jgi:hypothetical protein
VTGNRTSSDHPEHQRVANPAAQFHIKTVTELFNSDADREYSFGQAEQK